MKLLLGFKAPLPQASESTLKTEQSRDGTLAFGKGGSVVYQDGDKPLSYEHLEGDWGLFYKIAKYFVHQGEVFVPWGSQG